MGVRQLFSSTAALLLLNLVIGFVCLAVSGLILIYFYAFLSIVDPQLQGIDRWLRISKKMFGLYEGIVTIPMVLIFIASLGLIFYSAARLFALLINKKP